MSSYTKGKWAAEFDGEYWNVILADAEGIDYGIVGCEGLYRCDGSDEANARLIASAPELLVVVQKLASFYGKLWDSADVKGGGFLTPESVVQYDELHAEAANAIAKATGESA